MRLVGSLLAIACAIGFAAPMPGVAAPGMATTGSVPRPAIDYHALDRLGWKLSCQAWTFREMSLFETIDTIHNLGIRYIELFPGQKFSPDNPAGFDHNSPPAMVDALLKKLKASGITPVNYGVVGLDNNEANDRKVFDFAKKMHLLTIVSEPSPDSYALLDKLCAEYKINVAIHDHPKPDYYWNPETVLRVIAGHSKRIGACADTGHWYRSGLVPLECLQKLRGHIISLHLKDLTPDKVDTPWGTGECNVYGMLTELKKQHFRGVFSIEYEATSGAELVSNVAKCCAYFSAAAERLEGKRG